MNLADWDLPEEGSDNEVINFSTSGETDTDGIDAQRKLKDEKCPDTDGIDAQRKLKDAWSKVPGPDDGIDAQRKLKDAWSKVPGPDQKSSVIRKLARI